MESISNLGCWLPSVILNTSIEHGLKDAALTMLQFKNLQRSSAKIHKWLQCGCFVINSCLQPLHCPSKPPCSTTIETSPLPTKPLDLRLGAGSHTSSVERKHGFANKAQGVQRQMGLNYFNETMLQKKLRSLLSLIKTVLITSIRRNGLYDSCKPWWFYKTLGLNIHYRILQE